MVVTLGSWLSDEAVRLAGTIHATNQNRIWGKQQAIGCPGRMVEPGPLPRKEYQWQDSAPVSIRLSLLMINDIVMTGVSGEAMTMIHEHLKKESPFSHTVMVTHANGSSGYIPDDAAFDQVSYEITRSEEHTSELQSLRHL